VAAPGQFQYFLDGKDVFFVNSNDNKIIIRSDAPTVTINDAGIVRPAIGSLSLSPQTPVTVGTVAVPSGSLSLAGKQVNNPVSFPTLETLALAGAAPSLAHAVLPPTKSLVLTEFIGARFTGLWFEGFAPLAKAGEVVAPTVGACSFASTAPDVSIASPTAHVRVPEKRSVALTGQAPLAVVSNVVLPTVSALTLFGRLTNTNDVVFPTLGALGVTGYAPVPDRPGGEVTVLIEGPFNFGTFIRNPDAGPEPSNYQICDRTGFKIKIKHGLYEEWNHSLVRADSFEHRNAQDLITTKPDHQEGAERPEPIGEERFIEDIFPDGVDPEDL
jgi:hypothetical protein